MAENKTQENDAGVDRFLASVENVKRGLSALILIITNTIVAARVIS